jgi:hypothetical protein
MKHFLESHGVEKPTPDEHERANRRVCEYLRAVPSLTCDQAENRAAQCCLLEREAVAETITLDNMRNMRLGLAILGSVIADPDEASDEIRGYALLWIAAMRGALKSAGAYFSHEIQ